MCDIVSFSQPSLQSVELHPLPPTIPPPLPPHPVPNEAPPAYQTELPPYTEVKPAGIPVQLQVEGRTVMATLVQEVTYMYLFPH